MSSYYYEVNQAFIPDGDPIQKAKARLNTLRTSLYMLDEGKLASGARLIIAVGFYNSFYTVFEIIMQEKKKSLERNAYQKWKTDYPSEYQELNSLYHSFRDLLTHQGALLPESYLDWQEDIANDTVRPVSVFPKFMYKKDVHNKIIQEYTLKEWAVYCIDEVGQAIIQIEATMAVLKATTIIKNK